MTVVSLLDGPSAMVCRTAVSAGGSVIGSLGWPRLTGRTGIIVGRELRLMSLNEIMRAKIKKTSAISRGLGRNRLTRTSRTRIPEAFSVGLCDGAVAAAVVLGIQRRPRDTFPQF